MFSTLLTDISEALGYLNHELLITKLNAYGFTLPLIYNYLSNRKQRVQVIMVPLLFNIYLTDLLFTLNNRENPNYDDDTISYAVSNNMDDLIFEKMLMQMT